MSPLRIEIYGNNEEFSEYREPLKEGELPVSFSNIWSDEKRDEYILQCLSNQESSVSVLRNLEKGQELTSEMINHAVLLYILNESNGSVEMFLRTYDSYHGKRFRFSHI
jgi:hypothetical protein